jgi:3-oxoacyl-[acyl-carrier protein] reductase
VVVNDLDGGHEGGVDRVGAVVQEIRAHGGTAVAHRGSAVSQAGADGLVTAALDAFGRIDIMVNAAGIGASGSPFEVSDEQWSEVLGVHLGGHMACARAALPHMRAGRYGRIVTFTSGAGILRERSALFAYASAKRAVAAFTWKLADLVRTEGVTINAVSPLALTPMSAPPPGSVRTYLQVLPDPALIAPVVAYLASPAAAHIHGRVLFVNGFEVSLVDPPQPIEHVVGIDEASDDAVGAALRALVLPSAVADRSLAGASPRLAPAADP